MALESMTKMLRKAFDEHYAVGQFNINNVEWTSAVLEEAEKTRTPVILGVTSSAAKYMGGWHTVVGLVKGLMEDLKITVPVALHVDHGGSFEVCKAAIDAGFTSVMIDGSKLPIDENIAVVKKVVDYAHERGVSVEAELGKLAGVEDDVNVDSKDAKYTNVKEAVEFVKQTGCDSLAIAIGTSHGAYKFKGEAKLDFDRLKEIKDALAEAGYPDYPIVLHGSSSVPKEFVEKCNKFGGNLPDAQGVPEEMLNYASKHGVAKINIDTDLRLAMTSTIREFFVEHPEKFDPREYMGPGRTAVKEMVMHKMRDVLGTAGHAKD